jgi:diacylglycerol kinase (ATP)
MMKVKNTGITRILKAVGYSFEGMKSAFSCEAAFRQELLLFAISSPIAIIIGETPAEKALMIWSILLVLIVEIINTAVETTIERISTERHDLSKKAKDLGSAAVFLSLISAITVWVIIILG